MCKIIFVIALLIIIVFTFSFIVLRSLASGSEDNFFNQKYRLEFGESYFLRNVLGLHYDGDARNGYLDRIDSKILVEVDAMDGLNLSDESLDLLLDRIKQVTGKEVGYIKSDTLPFQDAVDEKQIPKLVQKYKSWDNSNDYIYLLVLSSSQQDLDLLGLTYQEDGIVLFEKSLQSFTQASPGTLNNYIESTALHEFGHQLGLDHNEESGCLMNAHAEKNHVALENPKSILTDFCDFEKLQINYYR